MLKKWLNHMLPKKNIKNQSCVRHQCFLDIPSDAAESVLNRLIQAGYEAYLVGGAVRDLLMGIEPKDFDVATNATPEQIKKVFRRSRIVGRRFPIAHVMIGSELIEVTTFRSGGRVSQNKQGRIVKDNHYGTLEQDAVRRDFTCNALYYDHKNSEVIDFHNGFNDIRAKRLVMIGDPVARYQEDPVRILRALRLSGKLGFEIDALALQAIPKHCIRLMDEPVSRLFDELLKILLSGHAERCLKILPFLGEDAVKIHPLLKSMVMASKNETHTQMAVMALRQTDERLAQGKHISVGFILAALLWSEVSQRWQSHRNQKMSSGAAMSETILQVRELLEQGWGMPQRFASTMREIWILQPQFEHRQGARPFRLMAQSRFRAAYDFLLLRQNDEPEIEELVQWWNQFIHAHEAERNQMVRPVPSSSDKKKRRKNHDANPKHRQRLPEKSMINEIIMNGLD